MTVVMGSFEWAMAQALAGKDVRRTFWPIEVTKAGKIMPSGCGTVFTLDRDIVDVWQVYRSIPITTYGLRQDAVIPLCKGWGFPRVGADIVGDFGIAGDHYTPSADDKRAIDWQLAADVTPQLIAYMDAHRVEHHPKPGAPDDDEQPWSLTIWALLGAAIIGAVVLSLWLARQ